MADPSQLIRYLRDCYRADNRETVLLDFFAKKVEQRFFLSGTEELLQGFLDRVPVYSKQALPAQKAAGMYRKMKSLVYAAFFIVGKTDQSNNLPSTICGPLLYFPATIVERDTVAYLSIDLERQRLNFPVFAALLGETETTANYLDDIFGRLPNAPIEGGELGELISVLEDFLPEVQCHELYKFPELISEKRLKEIVSSSKNLRKPKLECLPACAVGLIQNSPEARGVLSELAEISSAPSLSTPLRVLLDGDVPETQSTREPHPACVPAVLSASQGKVLESASTAPLTLITGPPGTGKSFTIAALALDHMSRGESVLIASRMNHAVDVVGRKIEDILGVESCVIRAGRKEYLRDLKQFLKHILAGIMPFPDRGGIPVLVPLLLDLHTSLKQRERQILRIEERLEKRGQWEQQWGEQTTLPPDSFLQGLLRSFHLRYLNWRLRVPKAHWDLASDYEIALQARTELISKILQVNYEIRVLETLRDHRKHLKNFLGAIRARSDQKQQHLFGEIDLRLLLGVFPIWLVSFADVYKVLPLQKELFDLAIVDEATQCDMASSLPVFQRAARLAITGDPQQLRHISFIPRQRQRVIADRYELDESQRIRLDYRDQSLLDLIDSRVSSQKQVLFLDEHFRSMPQIIRFSNREFYRDSLKVMTTRPDTVARRSVFLHSVSGTRESGGPNRIEAKALVDEVRKWIDSEAPLDRDMCHSLGILSPFRAQVDHIYKLLIKNLPLETVEKHDLQIGTSHTFQGEERDIMFLSLAVDPNSHSASIRFLNKPDVFNVAITRARNAQFVFASILPAQIKKDCLLRKYLEEISQDPEAAVQSTDDHGDEFLQEVMDELQRNDFKNWPSYPVAGLTVDLVVEKGNRTLGIDLIGYPGKFAGSLDLEKYRMFQRVGLRLFPLPYSAWTRDKALCLRKIEEAVQGEAP